VVDGESERMRIGEVAKGAGVSVRALRYYEEQGLLESDRSAGGQRQYSESAVERVRFIQNLYAAGLGSKAVLRILPCMEHGVLTDEMQERLLVERRRVQAQLDELTATRDKLDEVIRIGEAYRLDPTSCTAGTPTPAPARTTSTVVASQRRRRSTAVSSAGDPAGRSPRGEPGAVRRWGGTSVVDREALLVSTDPERPEPTLVGRTDLSHLTDTGHPGPERTEGEDGTAQVPPGYPEDIDTAEGPLAGRDEDAGRDLHSPANPLRHDGD